MLQIKSNNNSVSNLAFRRVYAIMQLAEHDLFSYMQTVGKLHENTASKFLRHVLSALDYMHSFEIMHRDVKPENIFICGNTAKLGDFGAACLGLTASDICGTEDYMAPELLLKSGDPYTYKVDIWACGVLAHEMLTEAVPLGGVPDLSQFAAAESLVEQLLQINADGRPSAREALLHPWLGN